MQLKKSILLLSLFLVSCSASTNLLVEEPRYAKTDQYVKHFAYSFVYHERWEQPKWVSYQLLASELAPNFKRTDKFLEDSLVLTKTATNIDYKGSGYDRGHLAPAADMTWNMQAMQESFYFSNISPQLPAFNRGIWKKLEAKVRDWAVKYGSVYITTGPICKNTDTVIGENEVVVPTHFYKALLVVNDSITQGIGFILPHQGSKSALSDFAVSIDEIEAMTGLDLYPSLPNKVEDEIEGLFDFNDWER